MRTIRTVAALTLSAAIAAAPAVATASPVLTGAPTTTVASAQQVDRAALRAKIQRLMPKTDTALKVKLDRLIGGHKVIDPTQYKCGPTALDNWVDASMADWAPEDLEILSMLGALDLPTYDALVFGSQGDPDYALGQDAHALNKTMKKLRSFWDIKSDDIQLMAMHGDMLLDTARTARVYEVVFGLSPADAQQMAELVAYFVSSQPYFEGGNHPIFTFNAFAYTSYGQEEPGLGVIGDRIIMGDGILQAYREMGYGDIAPQAILAHEFGHHVQFEIGMSTPDQVSTPESTRRTELHADASAAYFLSHPRGLSMQIKRVNEFLRVFYTIGDCHFDSTGHHGTPDQRERAGMWAYQLQENSRPKGKILPAREFARRFDAALPMIVAPDA